jgi:hypothetical protein
LGTPRQSGFTLLSEALALTLIEQEMPVNQVTRDAEGQYAAHLNHINH